MSYTIRIIEPTYITLREDGRDVVTQAPDGFVPPQSFVRLLWSSGNVQLWDDTAGTATWNDIKAQTGIVAQLIGIVKGQASEQIISKWPLWAQNNCALGIYSSATINQCKTDIAAVITASNTAEDLISNAVSMDAALAVKAVWPTL